MHLILLNQQNKSTAVYFAIMHNKLNQVPTASKKTVTKKIKPIELSQLFINLPKLGSSKKQQSINADELQLTNLPSNDCPKAYQQQYSSATRTDGSGSCSNVTSYKNSLSHFGIVKQERQIVLQWAKKKMMKLGLLGLHWEVSFIKKKQEFKQWGFQCLKDEFYSKNRQLLLESRQSFFKGQVRSIDGFGLQNLIEKLDMVVKNHMKYAFQIFKTRSIVLGKNRMVFINNGNPQPVRIYARQISPMNYYNSSEKVATIPANPNIRIKMNPEQYKKQSINPLRKVSSFQQIPVINNQYSMSPLVHAPHLHVQTPKKTNYVPPVQIPRPRPERKNEAYYSTNTMRPLSSQKTSDSHHNILVNQMPERGRMLPSNSPNIHTLSTKKRPVSASASLKVSCFGGQIRHQQPVYCQNHTTDNRNLRMSMQELSSRNYVYRNTVSNQSPQQLYVQQNQTVLLGHQNQYENERKQNQGRHGPGPQRKRSKLPENEYNLHRLGPQSPRNVCPPRVMP